MNETHKDIRVVRGQPTAEELAAAIAVVQAALAAAEADALKVTKRTAASTWNRNQGMFRGQISAGAGQWQAALRNGLN